MNLHLFQDVNHLFVPQFAEYVIKSTKKDKNLLFGYICELDISHKVLPFATPELVLSYIKNGSVNRVIFHGLRPQAATYIEKIKSEVPECRIDWVYWGETYDSYAWLLDNRTLHEYLKLGGFKARSFPYWLAKFMIKTNLTHILLGIRAVRDRYKTSKYAHHIDTFYHWSKFDYEHIKRLLNCKNMKYKKFFYDMFNIQIMTNNLIEHDLKCDPTQSIVIGHSASIRNNHLDILPAVCEFAVKRNKIVVCPLSYSVTSKDYINSIEKYMNEVPGLAFRLCYKFYSLADYLSFLSKCGAYISPARGSIGAGNMISYALAGGIPLTANGNSTGYFLKALGAEVAIYKNYKDVIPLLGKVFGSRCQKNQTIIKDYFSAKSKLECYENLLDVV